MDNNLKNLLNIPDNPTEQQQMALDNCIAVFLTGSRLYGTNTPSSDFDCNGLFIEPIEYIVGNNRCDEINLSTNKSNTRNTSEDRDIKLYSLRKFFNLAAQNNPNIVEFFFVPQSAIIYSNPHYFDQIIGSYELFISKRIKHTFSGYAAAQKKHLINKKKRLDDLKKSVEGLKSAINMGMTDVKDLSIPAFGLYDLKVMDKTYSSGVKLVDILESVIKEIGWYGNRTLSIDECGFDKKFASHVFRLIDEGIELLETGKLSFPCRNKDLQLEVKNGKYTLEEVLEMIEKKEPILEEVYNKSKIQHSPKHKEIGILQQKIIVEYWKERGII